MEQTPPIREAASFQASTLGFSKSTFLLSTALLLASYLWLYRWLQRKKLGPKCWPLLGASIELLMNYGRMHDWLLGYFEKATTIYVPLPGFSYTYTTDPKNVEYILKSNFSNFPKGKIFHEVMHPLLGNGIFNTDGDVWRKQRKTASFEFASKVLRDFSTLIFRDYALRLADILAQTADTNHTLDMQDLFMRLTLDSICKIGFGVETCSLSPHLPEVPFAKAFDKANYIVTLRFVDPLWKLKRLLKVGNEALLIHSIQVLEDFTYQVIQTRRTEMEAVKVLGTQEITKADLLSRFIILSEDLENHMDDQSLRDLVLNFVIAGRDTTAVTLSWFLYMIIRHPNVADKIRDELCAFESECLKKEDGSNCINMEPHKHHFSKQVADFASLLTYDSLMNLHYLHAAITETLRLYPAVPQDPKGILADDILPDGTRLRKGGLVAYVPYSMGRMAYLWGPDAHEYKPERWLKDGVFQNVSPFKFAAFQAGPRICLGKDSAYLQMKITTAILCRFFTFKLVSGHSMKYRMMSILHMAQGLEVVPSKWL